uniref:Vitamin K-dependent gamma-carboxylase n=1 Tax=Heterorhabditis bacteriophora TaxID=37862 RepID=A0A1I7XIG4_HETBA
MLGQKQFLGKMRWQMTTLLLCIYGFFKEFRPSEPYLYEYEHITLNISERILNSEVYPIWTYSYMMALIPVFLLADFICKPLIICEALSYVTVWVMFVFFRSVLVQQVLPYHSVLK